MRIAVIGSGYVGTTTAAVLASLEHHVTAVDIDSRKVEKLNQGVLPFVEPGLDGFLCSMLRTGRLVFTNQMDQAVRDNQVLFITVGTPPLPNGTADLQFLQSVADSIASSINGYKVIVTKSTIPVGTNRWLYEYLKRKIGNTYEFDIISNPEFLREGNALYDTLHPDRIILGGTSKQAIEMLKETYAPLHDNPMIVDWETAELIKYAANSFLATKISFINEIARIADQAGADVMEVARGMGLDPRIGCRHLHPGIGFGGSCFPKDLRALIQTARKLGVEPRILEAVESVNLTQVSCYLDKLSEDLQETVEKPWSIALLGMAFKPDTDDQRESPAIHIVNQLLEDCREIRVFDPTVNSRNQTPWPDERKVIVCSTWEDVFLHVDAAVLCTDWPVFKEIDWKQAAQLMRHPLLVDGRNIHEPQSMQRVGIRYIGLGRRIKQLGENS